MGFELKALHNEQIQTQIILDGHLLILRYKKKDHDDVKYAYTMYEEWFPRPQTVVAGRGAATPPAGTIPTPVLTVDEKQRHSRSVIISGVKNTAFDPNLANKFLDFMDVDDKGKVENIEVRRNNVMVACCTDGTHCKALVDKYNKKKFLEHTIYLSSFSGTITNSEI